MNAPWTYFFYRPPGEEQRGLVESDDLGGDDQRLDQLHDSGGHRRGLREAGVDEPGGHVRAGHVGQQPPGTAPRAGAGTPGGRPPVPAAAARWTRGVCRDAGRAGRHVGLPALALRLVQVMLDGDGLRPGDLFLLVRPRDPEVGGAVPGCPALAGALGEPVPGSHPGRSRSSPSRARRAACLACGSSPRPAPRQPLLPGRLAARRVHHLREASTSCRCSGTRPAPAGPPGPSVPRPGPSP